MKPPLNNLTILSLTTPQPPPKQLRVCTNKTCLKQGSLQTLQTLTSLSPPQVAVLRCGCLGFCGAGPNVAVLPDGVVVRHCGTPAKAAELVVVDVCGGSVSDVGNCLDALALRKRAESLRESGELSQAQVLLSQAIDLKPFGGIHIIFKDRSVVRLALGKFKEALEDAKQASALAHRYPEAFICEGDALLALEQFDAAQKSYLTALQIDPLIRRSKSFKAKITKLQEKLNAVEMP